MIKNTIINDDVVKTLKKISSNRISLIIADPPYGINYKKWDVKSSTFLKFTEEWVSESFRVLKNTGSFYSFMGWSNVAEFKLLLDKYGKIRNWITWHRTKGRGSSKNYKSMKEEILYYTKTNKYVWNEQKMLKKHIFPYTKNGKPRGWFTDENGVKCRWTGLGNVWFYTVPFWKMPEYSGHPSQKPILMMERMILSSSNKNDTVLELFAGSGPVCIAAKKLKRNYIGIEKDKKYCQIIETKLKKL